MAKKILFWDVDQPAFVFYVFICPVPLSFQWCLAGLNGKTFWIMYSVKYWMSLKRRNKLLICWGINNFTTWLTLSVWNFVLYLFVQWLCNYIWGKMFCKKLVLKIVCIGLTCCTIFQYHRPFVTALGPALACW